MKVFLAALLFVGLAVLGLGVNIFFLHRPFPDGEISTNPNMRRLGIRCAKQEEMERFSRGAAHPGCDQAYGDACSSCALYGSNAETKKK